MLQIYTAAALLARTFIYSVAALKYKAVLAITNVLQPAILGYS